MKTFIINGSPRKKGHTVYLIDSLRDKLDGEVKVISPYYDTINACIDCRYCQTHPRSCVIQDAMQDIYRCIETYDRVIVASPVYFMNMTPPMLGVMSRFQAYFSLDHPQLPVEGKEKKGAVILTGGGSGGYEGAEKNARLMLQMMNAEWAGTATSLNTDQVSAMNDLQVLEKINEIAQKFR